MISVTTLALLLAVIAVACWFFGRVQVAIGFALVALLIYLAHVSGYL